MATTRQGLVDRVKRVALRAGTRGARALVETAVVTVRTVDALQSKLQRVRRIGRRATASATAGIHPETLFTRAREQVAPVASTGAAAPEGRAPSSARTTSGQTRTRTPRARAAASGSRGGTPSSAAESRRTAVTPRGAIESARPVRTAASRGGTQVRGASGAVKTASRESGRKSVPGQRAAAKRGTAKEGPLKVKRGQKHRH